MTTSVVDRLCEAVGLKWQTDPCRITKKRGRVLHWGPWFDCRLESLKKLARKQTKCKKVENTSKRRTITRKR